MICNHYETTSGMGDWSTRWTILLVLPPGCTGWRLTRRRMRIVRGGWRWQRWGNFWQFWQIIKYFCQGITNTCHESYDRTDTKLGPEAFRWLPAIDHCVSCFLQCIVCLDHRLILAFLPQSMVCFDHHVTCCMVCFYQRESATYCKTEGECAFLWSMKCQPWLVEPKNSLTARLFYI